MNYDIVSYQYYFSQERAYCQELSFIFLEAANGGILQINCSAPARKLINLQISCQES